MMFLLGLFCMFLGVGFGFALVILSLEADHSKMMIKQIDDLIKAIGEDETNKLISLASSAAFVVSVGFILLGFHLIAFALR